MNEERDRFLTEAMGGCLCCTLEEGMEIEGTINGCDSTCVLPDNHNDCVYAEPGMKAEDCEYWQVRLLGTSSDFSTWTNFGKLWEWSQRQEWFIDFICGDIGHSEYCDAIVTVDSRFIHPDRFADALYGFLKQMEEGK